MEEQASASAWWRIRETIRESSSALSTLDVVRLEALAAWCRGLDPFEVIDASIPATAVRSVGLEILVLRRILDITRSNLAIVRNLQAVTENIEYGLDSNLVTP